MRTPTAAPLAANGAAMAATIAADRSSCTPPANSTWSSAAVSSLAVARKSSIMSSWACHNGKLARGPTWPPHSEPSNTNLRAPDSRNCPRSPGDGTCRKADMPTSSSAAACPGRPPAMMACEGRTSRMTSNWAFLTSSAAKPRTPTPQGLSPRVLRVSSSSARVCCAPDRASAMNGKAPSAATAAANAAWSLTRVIGPWATGSRVPRARLPALSGPSTGTSMVSASVTASRIPRIAAPSVPQRC